MNITIKRKKTPSSEAFEVTISVEIGSDFPSLSEDGDLIYNRFCDSVRREVTDLVRQKMSDGVLDPQALIDCMADYEIKEIISPEAQTVINNLSSLSADEKAHIVKQLSAVAGD